MPGTQELLQAYMDNDYLSLEVYLKDNKDSRIKHKQLSELTNIALESVLEASLLFLACAHNNLSMIKFLVCNGLDPNVGARLELEHSDRGLVQYDMSPLCLTIAHDYDDASRLLMDLGASPMQAMHTPQLLVKNSVITSILEYLIYHKRKSLGYQALSAHLSSHEPFVPDSVIDALILKDDFVNITILYNHLSIRAKLAKTDESSKNSHQISYYPKAIEMATRFASKDIFLYILNFDPHIELENLELSLQIASKSRNTLKIEHLIEHGAYTHRISENYKFIDWCIKKKYYEGLPFIFKKHASNLDDTEFDQLFMDISKRILLNIQEIQNNNYDNDLDYAFTISILKILELKRPISESFQRYIVSLIITTIQSGSLDILKKVIKSAEHYRWLLEQHSQSVTKHCIADALATAQLGDQSRLVLELLLELGFKPERKFSKNYDVLEHSIYHKNLDLAKVLIEHGVVLQRGYKALLEYAEKLPDLLPLILACPQSPFTQTEVLQLALKPYVTLSNFTACMHVLLKHKIALPSVEAERYETLYHLARQVSCVQKDRLHFIFPSKAYALLDPKFVTLETVQNIYFTLSFDDYLIINARYLQNDKISTNHLTLMIMQHAKNLDENIKTLKKRKYQDTYSHYIQKFTKLETELMTFENNSIIENANRSLNEQLQQVLSSLRALDESLKLIAQQQDLDIRRKKQLACEQEKYAIIKSELNQYVERHAKRVACMQHNMQLLRKRYQSIKDFFLENKLDSPNYAKALLSCLQQPLMLVIQELDEAKNTHKKLVDWLSTFQAQTQKLNKQLAHIKQTKVAPPDAQALEEEQASVLLDVLERRLNTLKEDLCRDRVKRDDWRSQTGSSLSPLVRPSLKRVDMPTTVLSRVESGLRPRPQAASLNLHAITELTNKMSLQEKHQRHLMVLQCPFPTDLFHQRMAQNSLLASCARLFEQLKRFKDRANASEARQARNLLYHSDFSDNFDTARKRSLETLAHKLSYYCSELINKRPGKHSTEFNPEHFFQQLVKQDPQDWSRQMAVSWQDWVDMTSQIAAPEVPEPVVALAKSFVIARLSTCAQKIRHELPLLWLEYAPHHEQLLCLIDTGKRLRHGSSF